MVRGGGALVAVPFPVFGLSSIAPAMPKFGCSWSAMADLIGSSWPPLMMEKSVRMKLPFAARPGPFAGSRSSLSTSILRPVIPSSEGLIVSVVVSVPSAGFAPIETHESSVEAIINGPARICQVVE